MSGQGMPGEPHSFFGGVVVNFGEQFVKVRDTLRLNVFDFLFAPQAVIAMFSEHVVRFGFRLSVGRNDNS